MEHKFEFDGIEYTWRRGTIRDVEARKVIVRKILRACGWETAAIPDVDNTFIYRYADTLAHLSPVKVAWWRDAGDAPEAVAEGYHAFSDMDEDFYDLLDTAAAAVAPLKKTTTNPPLKSSD